jgi:hypothetical protein
MYYSDQYTYVQENKKFELKSLRDYQNTMNLILDSCIAQIKSVCSNLNEAVQSSALFRLYLAFCPWKESLEHCGFMGYLKAAADTTRMLYKNLAVQSFSAKDLENVVLSGKYPYLGSAQGTYSLKDQDIFQDFLES